MAERARRQNAAVTITLSQARDASTFQAGDFVVTSRQQRRPWWQHYPLALASAALRPLGVHVPVPRTVRETRRIVGVSGGTATLTVEPAAERS
jgi:hypothetical protein